MGIVWRRSRIWENKSNLIVPGNSSSAFEGDPLRFFLFEK